MKKHRLGKHLVVRGMGRSANMTFDSKELQQEKFKKRFVMGYEAIIDHFGKGNPY